MPWPRASLMDSGRAEPGQQANAPALENDVNGDAGSEGCRRVGGAAQGCSEPSAFGRSVAVNQHFPRGIGPRGMVGRLGVRHEGSFNNGRAALRPG